MALVSSLLVIAFSVCCAFVAGLAVETSVFEVKEEVSLLSWKRSFPSISHRRVNGTNRTCYGDVRGLSPTGEATGGVPGSVAEVKLDIPELKKRWAFYQKVADANCIQASVIAAVASRESRGGALLYKTDGYGDYGRAYGILQCDLKHSGLPCLKYYWSSQDHIQMMVSQLLVPYIKQIGKKFPVWTKNQTLQGGVAAYNKGVGRVTSWPGVDRGTTHNDYSNDVIARAKYLYTLGWN